MSKKKVILEFGTVRILHFDHLNYVVEYLDKMPNGHQKWRFKAYVSTIYNALSLISKREWLIDKEKVSDLNDYLKQVEQSNNKLIEAIK